MLLTRNWRLGVFEQNMLCGAMFRIYSSIYFGIYLFIYLLLTTDTGRRLQTQIYFPLLMHAAYPSPIITS